MTSVWRGRGRYLDSFSMEAVSPPENEMYLDGLSWLPFNQE